MTLEFDSEREPTGAEMILAQRAAKLDWAAILELITLRAIPPVTRAQLEALPISELTGFAERVSAALKQAVRRVGQRDDDLAVRPKGGRVH